MRNPYRRTNVPAMVLAALLVILLIAGGYAGWRILTENNDLKAVSAGQSETIAALEDTSAAQNETISGLEADKAAQAETITTLESANDTLTGENTVLTGEKDALSATVSALETTNAEQAETIAALENDKAILAGTTAAVNADKVTLTAENETLTAQVETLTAENEALTAENAALSETVATLEAANTAQAETITALQDEKEDLTGDIDEKDDLIELYESVTPEYSLVVGQMGYRSWIRVHVNASKTGRINSVTVTAGGEGEVGRAAAEDEAFLNQFVGKYLPIDPDEVDTVAGATETTQAVIDGLARLKLRVPKNDEN